MRNMSFAMTEEALLNGQKTVTRRLGWESLKPGDKVRAVYKVMGLRKGEKVRTLAILEIISVRREPLHAITDDDVAREGFPNMPRSEFVGMFARAMRCPEDQEVTRIEFRTLEDV